MKTKKVYESRKPTASGQAAIVRLVVPYEGAPWYVADVRFEKRDSGQTGAGRTYRKLFLVLGIMVDNFLPPAEPEVPRRQFFANALATEAARYELFIERLLGERGTFNDIFDWIEYIFENTDEEEDKKETDLLLWIRRMEEAIMDSAREGDGLDFHLFRPAVPIDRLTEMARLMRSGELLLSQEYAWSPDYALPAVSDPVFFGESVKTTALHCSVYSYLQNIRSEDNPRPSYTLGHYSGWLLLFLQDERNGEILRVPLKPEAEEHDVLEAIGQLASNDVGERLSGAQRLCSLAEQAVPAAMSVRRRSPRYHNVLYHVVVPPGAKWDVLWRRDKNYSDKNSSLVHGSQPGLGLWLRGRDGGESVYAASRYILSEKLGVGVQATRNNNKRYIEQRRFKRREAIESVYPFIITLPDRFDCRVFAIKRVGPPGARPGGSGCVVAMEDQGPFLLGQSEEDNKRIIDLLLSSYDQAVVVGLPVLTFPWRIYRHPGVDSKSLPYFTKLYMGVMSEDAVGKSIWIRFPDTKIVFSPKTSVVKVRTPEGIACALRLPREEWQARRAELAFPKDRKPLVLRKDAREALLAEFRKVGEVWNRMSKGLNRLRVQTSQFRGG